ncbi:g8535 [Coccomyxa viridis]|uniref:G8535 protein n=1 Tax=Coccomyxa viridis TaxID=1274662 RepID=A0ABP1G6Z8_9CHLO
MTVPLNELVISGVPTTTQYHEMILEIEDFVNGNVDTGFIPKHADQLTDPPPPKTRSLQLYFFDAPSSELTSSCIR